MPGCCFCEDADGVALVLDTLALALDDEDDAGAEEAEAEAETEAVDDADVADVVFGAVAAFALLSNA